MRTKKQKEQQAQSTKLAGAAGIVRGMNARATVNGVERITSSPEGVNQLKKLFKLRGRTQAIGAVAGGLGLAATIQNFRGSNGLGDFVKQGFKNIGANVGGGLLGALTPIGGTATLTALSVGGKSKKTKSKKMPTAKRKKAATDSKNRKKKDGKKGDMTFIRKNGRVIPVRKKK